MSRTVRLIIIALLLYIGGYVAFRQTHIDIWQHDKQAYETIHGISPSSCRLSARRVEGHFYIVEVDC